jgi:hypothetical protein
LSLQKCDLIWVIPHYMAALAPGRWVDKGGDLWLCDQVTKPILRLPVLDFSAQASSIYDWAAAPTMVKPDGSPAKFVPTELKIAPERDLYVQGTVEGKCGMSWFWMGGTAIARFSPKGRRR